MPDVVRAGKDRQESSDGNQAGREREREGVIPFSEESIPGAQ